MGAFIFALNGFTGDVAPIAFGFSVVHHKRVPPEISGYAETVYLSFKFPDIHDAGETKRSPGYRYMNSADKIVNYLMPVQMPGGISPCIAVDD